MSKHPISRYPVPEIAELPDGVRDHAAVQEKSGFVPNAFLALVHRLDQSR